ncbi:serine hydrolase domain-containing protein [Bacillus thuringiensis]
MEHYNVSGLSIAFIENGEVQMTKEFGVMKAGTNRSVNSNSIFNACSISKFLTAMLVLKLTEQGILYLDEDINNKLIFWKVTENEYTHNKKVTLRTLLIHI